MTRPTAVMAEASGPKPLSGAEKAAAILLAMGKPAAARLLKYFDADDLRDVTRAAAKLGTVPTPVIDALIDLVVEKLSRGPELTGSATQAENLLTGTLPPDQVAEIMADVLGSSNQSSWTRLSRVPAAMLGPYLLKEHPQTAAFIMTKLDPDAAAQAMSALPAGERNQIMQRMLNCHPVPDFAAKIVEHEAVAELLSSAPRKDGSQASVKMAAIMNKMEKAAIDEMLNGLEAISPKDAGAIKALLFDFDDIATLPQPARMVIFDQVSTELVVLALRDTSPEMQNLVLASMAARARRIVESELSSGQSMPQKEILKARRTIADLVLKLAERGQIELRPATSEPN